MITSAANILVRTVRAAHRRQVWLSVAGLALTLIVATAYLLIGALRVTPFASTYRVTVQLTESGGLLPNQDVALRGVRIGRVESLRITDQGVDAVARITSTVKIPANAVAHVSALSPAGEQYIDFEADSDTGPYLHDGSLIALNRTSVPVSLAQLLGDADGLLAQVDPRKIELIKKELSLSREGPGKLTAIVDGGMMLLSTLDSVLPETTSIIRTSRVVLNLAADKNAGLAAATVDFRRTLAGVARMQDGYRRLTGTAPQQLSTIDRLFDDNSETMVQLLGSLATASQLLYLRVPALNALFPDYRGSAIDALASAFHDHAVWATAELYPRYACDYGTPAHPPSGADYYEPFIYTYCRDDDPGYGIRGAKN
ncbi:mammalian cell entry protein, partial [Mycobacterium intermedium]